MIDQKVIKWYLVILRGKVGLEFGRCDCIDFKYNKIFIFSIRNYFFTMSLSQKQY